MAPKATSSRFPGSETRGGGLEWTGRFVRARDVEIHGVEHDVEIVSVNDILATAAAARRISLVMRGGCFCCTCSQRTPGHSVEERPRASKHPRDRRRSAVMQGCHRQDPPIVYHPGEVANVAGTLRRSSGGILHT